MSRMSLLVLPLVGALAVSVTGTALANPWLTLPVSQPDCTPTPVGLPRCSVVSAPGSAAPGELPDPEPPPARHTLTVYNGPCAVQQNFVEQNGSWRGAGQFTNYDVFFRDSPQVPWRFYGTYYSARSAEDAASILSANGNLASVRPYRA